MIVAWAWLGAHRELLPFAFGLLAAGAATVIVPGHLIAWRQWVSGQPFRPRPARALAVAPLLAGSLCLAGLGAHHFLSFEIDTGLLPPAVESGPADGTWLNWSEALTDTRRNGDGLPSRVRVLAHGRDTSCTVQLDLTEGRLDAGCAPRNAGQRSGE